MIYEIGMLLFVVFIGVVGLWFAYKFFKRKRKMSKRERDFPEEVLEKFNKAEENLKGGFKEDGTTTSPYKILWEIARKNQGGLEGSRNRSSIGTEQTVDDRELLEQSNGRQSIPDRIATDTNENKQLPRKSKPNNLGRVISRIRRRNT